MLQGLAVILQFISNLIVGGYKGIEGFFVNGVWGMLSGPYNVIEGAVVGGWAWFLDFLLNTVGLKAFWETITNVTI